MFCSLKPQKNIFLSRPEAVNDAATMLTYKDKLQLPKDPRGTFQDPGGTELWIIARLGYKATDQAEFSTVLFGWTRLSYKCENGSGSGTATLETCSYHVSP
jgi:hypothetical protein